ncbi:MAG: hypothetical protein JXA42_04785 [Anaerolineales bacterium]|nr:hypothetical protein [Anaerolineales bacterium]
MSRVINPNPPGKTRNYHMRSLAEILRGLAAKGNVDDEAKDMASAMVFILRDIDKGVDVSAQAWEKRDYWLKADRFRLDWEWAKQAADDVEDVIREDAWDLFPRLMMDLFPHFADVRIKKLTRKPELWKGAYALLMAEPAND